MRRKIFFGLVSVFAVTVTVAITVVVAVIAFPGTETSGDRPSLPTMGSVASTANSATMISDSTTTSERRTMTIEASVSKNAVMPEAQAKYSEIIVYGTVTSVAPGRWNSSDGKVWTPAKETDTPVIYGTFYVEPIQVLKGEPRFGTPVAFMIPGGTEGVIGGPVAVGDRVIVFGRYMQQLYGDVYWDREAYFPQSMEYSIYVENADGKLTNLGDQHLAALNDMTVEQMTMMAASTQ